jgi:hypothetical protein
MSKGEDEIEELRSFVADLDERVTELERRLDGGEKIEATDGISEFVESVDPSSHKERTLAIGYYYETYRGYENFTNDDIEEGYRESRIPRPANIRDVMSKLNNKEGWTIQDGKEGRKTQYRISKKGQEWIEEQLEDD